MYIQIVMDHSYLLMFFQDISHLQNPGCKLIEFKYLLFFACEKINNHIISYYCHQLFHIAKVFILETVVSYDIQIAEKIP